MPELQQVVFHAMQGVIIVELLVLLVTPQIIIEHPQTTQPLIFQRVVQIATVKMRGNLPHGITMPNISRFIVELIKENGITVMSVIPIQAILLFSIV